MGVANVFLSADAYARLRAAKKANESFSDVVMREVSQQIEWDEYFGCCKGMNAEEAKRQVKRERERKWKNTF